MPRLSRGGVRDQRVDAAVLRPGDRTLRARAAARRAGVDLPAERAGAAGGSRASWSASATTRSTVRPWRMGCATTGCWRAPSGRRRHPTTCSTSSSGPPSGRPRRSRRRSSTARSSADSPSPALTRNGTSSACPASSNPIRSASCCGIARRVKRDARRVASPSSRRSFRTLGEQRKLLNSLVAIRARRTGQPHALVHAEIRRICGGPEVARATVAQLQARIDFLRRGRDWPTQRQGGGIFSSAGTGSATRRAAAARACDSGEYPAALPRRGRYGCYMPSGTKAPNRVRRTGRARPETRPHARQAVGRAARPLAAHARHRPVERLPRRERHGPAQLRRRRRHARAPRGSSPSFWASRWSSCSPATTRASRSCTT